jgi:ADP-ribosyl-[dinitrogen reductase] hydrolase
MLTEIAQADSYGAGFEFADPSPGRPNDVTFYVRNPRYALLHPGMYTDDGQMSLAVAECLLEGGRDCRAFASSFVRAFQRDPRDGYARKFQAFLESVTDVDDFLARIVPASNRSGAAMRAAPIGLLPTTSEVLEITEIQAKITHDTPMSIAAAQGAALMAHHQAYEFGPISDLPAFLTSHVPAIDWSNPFRGRTKSAGEEIVRAALAVLLDAESLSGVMRTAVAFGGDTDTSAENSRTTSRSRSSRIWRAVLSAWHISPKPTVASPGCSASPPFPSLPSSEPRLERQHR